MVKRLYVPIFGSGIGHASRTILIAEYFRRRNVDVKFSSSADIVEYIKHNGFKYKTVPLVDIQWDEDVLSVSNVTRKALPALKDFLLQIVSEIGAIQSFQPNLVLSDSRLSAIIAAKLLKIPSFVILNQIRISFSSGERKFLSILEEIEGEVLGKFWSFCKGIILPDLPPPYTISERNLWGIKSIQNKVHYVGFLVSKSILNIKEKESIYEKLKLKKGKPTIFAQISGPNPTKKNILKILFETAKMYRDSYNFIISGGMINGNSKPIKIYGGIYYEWCPIKDTLFTISDMVIIRGGHSSIAQSISLGKPMILLPISNHSEQISNAKKVSKLGLGVLIDQKNAKVNTIHEAITNIIKNDYFQNVSKIQKIANQINGLENTINLIKDYVIL